jgi:glucosamine 6-phosphate synthetase-like amidotransferase/phosphosugar isomerase protein
MANIIKDVPDNIVLTENKHGIYITVGESEVFIKSDKINQLIAALEEIKYG